MRKKIKRKKYFTLKRKIKKYLEMEEEITKGDITKSKAALKVGIKGKDLELKFDEWLKMHRDKINEIKRSRCYDPNEKIQHEIAVFATMSSGKSTVINALLGKDLLPNQNEACTAKIFKIIDNDKLSDYRAKVLYKDGCKKKVDSSKLEELNNDKNIKEIIIEGDFKGIKNKVVDKKLHQISLIDTPGPNNSLDSSHEEIANRLMKDENTDYLLYVLNATQIGINDDKKILVDILESKKEMEERTEVLFLLNKIDQIDIEKENLNEIVSNAKNYLKNIGFRDPKIIPVSAYAAKIFKLALDNNLKTRKEKKDFYFYYDLFEKLKLSNLVPKKIKRPKQIVIKNKVFYENKILEKLYATGLLDIEKELSSFLKNKINLSMKKRKKIENTEDKKSKEQIEKNKGEKIVIRIKDDNDKEKLNLDSDKKLREKVVKKEDKINLEESFKNKIAINYNPYTYELIISGVAEKRNSKLRELISRNSDKNLQSWYKELIKKIAEELNSKAFLIDFKGREIEYLDLKDEINLLNKSGWNISINYNELKLNEKDIFNKLNEFVLDIKNNAPTGLLKSLKKENVFEEFYKAKDSDAYVSVIATMSSGKSTLINGILGQELLPSKNEACTATISYIKDIDEMNNFRVRVEDFDKKEVYGWQEANINFLEEINEKGNQRGLNIYLEGDIPDISSQEMNLVVVDTPGPNNSQNSEHKELTYKFIRNSEDNPLVLYVMNATQHATNDDNSLLSEIADIINKKGKQAEERFLFAINKIDAFDPEREDISKLIENSKKYLESKNIKNPKIFPISAEFAKLKKLSMNNSSLTRTQRKNLNGFKEIFMPDLADNYEGIDTIKYASIPEKEKDKLYKEAKENEDKGNLHYSGLSALEYYIDSYVSKYAKTQKINGAITSLKKVLDTEYSEMKTIYKKTDKELEEIKKSILTVKNVLDNQGEKELEIIKKRILNIQADKSGFGELIVKQQKLFRELEDEFNNGNSSPEKAKVILEEAVKELETLAIKAKVTIENILKDQVQEKAGDILEALKKYFNELLDEINIDKDLLTTISGTVELNVLSDLGKSSVNRMIDNYTQKEQVYAGQRFSHTRSTSKWWNPFSWGSSEDVYEDVYKTVEKVDLNKIFYEKISPVGINFRKIFDDYQKDLDKQVKSVKDKGIEKVDDLKIIIGNKLEALNLKLNKEDELQTEKNDVNNNMELISKYKKNLDSILSI